MIVYKHWAVVKERINIEGKPHEINCYGGSDLSVDDAKIQAYKKARLIEGKINGHHSFLENYQVEIREELIERIDEKNAITRNRYGALVLNSADTLFLDIDQPELSFFDRFRSFTTEQLKEKMLAQIIKTCAEKEFKNLNFRIYETNKGYRIIVSGHHYSVYDPMVENMFTLFNCDKIYTSLCYKQDCFRARLTPKPTNMKLKNFKVEFPREPNNDQAFQNWLKGYQDKAQEFSVCRLTQNIGPEQTNSVVLLHDKYCGVSESKPLA